MPVVRDEVNGPRHVTGGQYVIDRFSRQPRRLIPGAGPFMQGEHHLWLDPGQAASEHLREELVIAEPVASLVERYDEEILPLEDVDDRRRVACPGHHIAERRAKPAEDSGPREELPDLGGLPAENFLDEESSDEPVVAGELADEVPGRGMTAKGPGREIDSRRPSFGPPDQIG